MKCDSCDNHELFFFHVTINMEPDRSDDGFEYAKWCNKCISSFLEIPDPPLIPLTRIASLPAGSDSIDEDNLADPGDCGKLACEYCEMCRPHPGVGGEE